LENAVLRILAERPAGKAEISARLGQKRVSGQLNKVVRALLDAGMIEHTIPEKPTSRLQKYRIKSEL
jgi:predicted transcriptional regulator